MHPRTVSEIIAAKFTDCVRRAVSCQLSAIEVIAAAEELTRCNESALARELYKLWIAHNPADPLLHAINFNYGVLLNESGQLADAQAAFTTAIEARPDFLSPYINLGTLLERAGNLDEAVKCWLEVVNRLPTVTADALKHKTVALKQMGRVLEANGRPDQAEAMFQACLDLNPNQRDVLQHWIAVRQTQCKWPVLAPWGSISSSMVMQALSPLSAAILIDDPVLQLANAWHYYRQDIASSLAQTTAGGWPTSGARGSRRLRIGYVSSDLREHAIGFLTAELFELHDRTNVEVLAYYCGPRTEDELQQRIRRAVDHWIDISDLTDQQAASRIVEDGIDILVDVNGYTKDARLKLFSLRPAPIIVNWLGFPGSMATPHHNYIIADQTIIPPDAERFYSEKIMRLPCYQPNDRHRKIAAQLSTRADAGLPQGAFVFCCFNGTQKITPATFQRWMAILRAAPKAVLWLLSGGDAADQNLRQHAMAQNIEPDRLVFAPRKHNAEHLARYPLADLFLDTAPYGAHTTASDAMWMGVPVITTPGRSFASRVCASLVRAAGLPELACSTHQEYVQRAIALANDPVGTKMFKERLAAGRGACTLFDTLGLVRSLEGLYAQMWAEFEEGRLPRPDLANLELYHDIACRFSHADEQEPFERKYLAALAYQHAVSPVRPDSRLWTETATPT